MINKSVTSLLYVGNHLLDNVKTLASYNSRNIIILVIVYIHKQSASSYVKHMVIFPAECAFFILSICLSGSNTKHQQFRIFFWLYIHKQN
jgi:hypothetical protein